MIISRGDPMIFLNRPISLTLLCIAVAALVIVFLPQVAKKREQVFVEED
jgi:TctA family transporter